MLFRQSVQRLPVQASLCKQFYEMNYYDNEVRKMNNLIIIHIILCLCVLERLKIALNNYAMWEKKCKKRKLITRTFIH